MSVVESWRLDHLAAVLALLSGGALVSLAAAEGESMLNGCAVAVAGALVVLHTHRPLLLAAKVIVFVLSPAALLLLAGILLLHRADGARLDGGLVLALDYGVAAAAAFVAAFILVSLGAVVVREGQSEA